MGFGLVFLSTIISFTQVSASQRKCSISMSPWVHVNTMSSGDIQALVDFQWSEKIISSPRDRIGIPASSHATTDATWLNLRMPGLRPTDKIHVMVINHLANQYRGGSLGRSEDITEYVLDFAESGRFTGKLEPLLIWEKLNDGYGQTSRWSERVEVAIWINDYLYKNPADNRNLGFNFNEYGVR
jgi:hypothetical protein